ncbi:hypothetical protein TNCV_2224931 [Trichonephila clavipes]|nr:hypothetical protein TNCV_2224931 [Trichonephila clavipes]
MKGILQLISLFQDVKRPNIPTDDAEKRFNDLRNRAYRNSEERSMEMKMRGDIVYNFTEEIVSYLLD